MTASPTTCSHCGAPLRPMRGGVRMTPLKARIFDLINRAGPDGITACDIRSIAFSDREVVLQTIKMHVWQISDAIADSGLVIRSRRGAHHSVFVLEQRHAEAAE